MRAWKRGRRGHGREEKREDDEEGRLGSPLLSPLLLMESFFAMRERERERMPFSLFSLFSLYIYIHIFIF